MNSIKVRNVVIGEGIPKICVPIVGKTKEEIINQARKFETIQMDIVEWRVDWFEEVFDVERVKEVLVELRAVLKEIPLIFTFRTAKEGGEKEITEDAYAFLNKEVAKTGYADMVDVELFTGENVVKDIIKTAHKNDVKVILSNHDFMKTPAKDEMICRLRKMQALDADVSKIAVMPQNHQDVLTLLAATEEMVRAYANRPIVTMSMSSTGVLSRICGEIFGSSMTFGAVDKTSAPGQMPAESLNTVLQLIHKCL